MPNPQPAAPDRVPPARDDSGGCARPGRRAPWCWPSSSTPRSTRSTTFERSVRVPVLVSIPRIVTSSDLSPRALAHAASRWRGSHRPRHDRRHRLCRRPRERAAGLAPARGRLVRIPDMYLNVLRARGETFQRDPRPEIPLHDAGAPGGARPAPVRNPGAEGLHRPDRAAWAPERRPSFTPSVQRLNGQSAVSFVVNSTLPFDGLLEYVLAGFGHHQGRGDSRAQRLIALNNFLIERERDRPEHRPHHR